MRERLDPLGRFGRVGREEREFASRMTHREARVLRRECLGMYGAHTEGGVWIEFGLPHCVPAHAELVRIARRGHARGEEQQPRTSEQHEPSPTSQALLLQHRAAHDGHTRCERTILSARDRRDDVAALHVRVGAQQHWPGSIGDEQSKWVARVRVATQHFVGGETHDHIAHHVHGHAQHLDCAGRFSRRAQQPQLPARCELAQLQQQRWLWLFIGRSVALLLHREAVMKMQGGHGYGAAARENTRPCSAGPVSFPVRSIPPRRAVARSVVMMDSRRVYLGSRGIKTQARAHDGANKPEHVPRTLENHVCEGIICRPTRNQLPDTVSHFDFSGQRTGRVSLHVFHTRAPPRAPRCSWLEARAPRLMLELSLETI